MTDLLRWAKEKYRQTTYTISGRTETEKLVFEATNDDKWGPANSQMQEIARLTYNYHDCELIKKALWERLEQIEEVRYVQKGLLLLEYLLRNGHESIRQDGRQMMSLFRSLTSLNRYQVGEPAALEQVIRKKAQDVITMITDDETYQMERQKAQKLKSNIAAVTNDGYGTYNTYNNSGNDFGNNYGGGYGSSSPYDLPSRSSTKPKKSHQKQQQFKPQNNDDEYEYEYSDDVPAKKPAQQQPTQFQQVQQPNTQPNPSGNRLAPPPGFKPTNKPLVVQQGNFDPFGNTSPAPQPAAPAAPVDDLLFGFGTPSPAPAQQPPIQQYQQPPMQQQFVQQPPMQQQLVQQPPMQQQFVQQPLMQQQAPSLDDLLDFTPKPAAAPAPAPMQQQYTQQYQQQAPHVQQKPTGGMLAEFGDIIDFNNISGKNVKTYGKAEAQMRGPGYH